MGFIRQHQGERLWALHNLSGRATKVTLQQNSLPEYLVDVLTGDEYNLSGSTLEIHLQPYQSVWLT